MPRKKFLEDFAIACADPPAQIHDLCKGEDDGTVHFLWTSPQFVQPVKVFALVSDLSLYPASHDFMLYTDDDAPSEAAELLQRHVPDSRRRSSLGDLLTGVSSISLSALTTDEELDDHSTAESSMLSADEYESDGGFNDNFSQPDGPSQMERTARELDAAAKRRLHSDLTHVRSSGYRTGVCGAFLTGASGIISISQRVKKLGLSSEALTAWGLKPDEYFVVLIRFLNGYRTLEDLLNPSEPTLHKPFEICVGLSETYKPASKDAFAAFTKGDDKRSDDNAGHSTFKDTFISHSLYDMINERLLKLLHYRSAGMSWSEAETRYHEFADSTTTDQIHTAENASTRRRKDRDDDGPDDHFSHKGERSFPLLAMQFALRHFLQCTEFCLVCHRKLNERFEALKPYVCERPLCLYQYMSLGFGPRIEHEILSQPMVVDLLVSFCYSSAMNSALPELPNGLNIMLPSSYGVLSDAAAAYLVAPRPNRLQLDPPSASLDAGLLRLKLDPETFDAVAQVQSTEGGPSRSTCPFRVGDWVVLQVGVFAPCHCRIVETQYWPTLKFGDAASIKEMALSDPTGVTPRTKPITTKGSAAPHLDAYCQKYDVHFDALEKPAQNRAIMMLLNTLPTVKEMQGFLTVRNKDLKKWSDRISPYALAVLRWIIASNRSCIVQVDGSPSTAGVDLTEERACGMPTYFQFRFAMGSPDKERRFVSAVRQTMQRLTLAYPTFFAFHGSPLKNWHAIIRHGLDYRLSIAHGRAFGDGVYHSLSANVSLGYASGYQPGANMHWPSSRLKPTVAMSLNEIVNAPAEFQSSNPHYVVKQLDWIQTRYLFVRSAEPAESLPKVDEEPVDAYVQDPVRTPKGERETKIVIPARAIKSAAHSVPTKRKRIGASTKSSKKSRGSGSHVNDPMDVDADNDDRSSEATDLDDKRFFDDLAESLETSMSIIDDNNHGGNGTAERSYGSFVPGKLDFSQLPMMPEPSYASSATTRRLQRDFRDVLKLQDSVPPVELGWYIDAAKLENVYQWIVELHSFEQFEFRGKPLPLATDMLKAGVNSIVLEMRFPASYPMDPPFVRVIQPRFLGFQQGGGGNVTAGGAMCMELLTNSGWTAVSTIESVLLQIRLAIAGTDPQPARLESRRGDGGSYGIAEAVDAYKRAVRTHGWTMPPEFDRMMLAQQRGS